MVENGRMVGQNFAKEGGTGPPRSDDQQLSRQRRIPVKSRRLLGGLLQHFLAGLNLLVQNVQRCSKKISIFWELESFFQGRKLNLNFT